MSQTNLPPSVGLGPSSPSSGSSAAINTPPSTIVMSSPRAPRGTSSEGDGGVALPGLHQTSRPEPRDYSTARYPPTGFGSRLANARNLRPDEAPTAPPARKHPAPTQFCVKGSYISPYGSGGGTPRHKRLFAESTTVEEFEAKYGAAAVRAKAAAQDASAQGGIKIDRSATPFPASMADEDETPGVSHGTQDRLLFLGPLKIIRAEAASKAKHDADMAQLDRWFSTYMHEDLHKVHMCDEMIPSVVYSVKISMTEENWLNYNQALAHFACARDFHNLLALGKEEFDQVSWWSSVGA